MNQEGDEKRGQGEHEEPAAEEQNNPEDKMTLVIELGSPPSENKHADYEEGRIYKWTYLGTQIILAGVTSVGIVIAVCTLISLNRNVADSHTQAIAAATQAQIAQQEFELSERPWIYPKVEIASAL